MPYDELQLEAAAEKLHLLILALKDGFQPGDDVPEVLEFCMAAAHCVDEFQASELKAGLHLSSKLGERFADAIPLAQ